MGIRLADFVQFLNNLGVAASSLHVIGFSLGAEAAGFGGKELRKRGLRLGRITGKLTAYIFFIIIYIHIILLFIFKEHYLFISEPTIQQKQ